LLYKIFWENKKLNLELGSASSEIATLRLGHDNMSAKPCDNCKMIMVNYADLWLDGARLEVRELKLVPHFLVTTCPLLRSDLEAAVVEIKDLNTNLIILLATLFYLLHVKHVSLSRISFSMLPKRTPSYNRRLLI
jgi:hypothetical protein